MRPALVVLFLFVAAAGCSVLSPPTQGPEVRIGPNQWTAEPVSMVQTGEWFEFTVENTLDTGVRFVVLTLNYGKVSDIPVVDGLVDVNRQVLYESSDPLNPGDPVVAYALVFPGPTGEGAPWGPAILDAGAATTVQVGNPGLGGGEAGRFVVVSYETGGLEQGHFVVFDMTDEDGVVPQFTLEDFFPTDEPEP
jgi:hypothetical protein